MRGGLVDFGTVASESGVVRVVKEDTKEICALFVRVRLQLRMDVDDEGGGHSGEETSLSLGSVRVDLYNLQNSQLQVLCSGLCHASSQDP